MQVELGVSSQISLNQKLNLVKQSRSWPKVKYKERWITTPLAKILAPDQKGAFKWSRQKVGRGECLLIRINQPDRWQVERGAPSHLEDSFD